MRKRMEPKAVKEESSDKEICVDSSPMKTRSSKALAASKEPSKAPDSPETSRTVANQLPSVSPTQSSPQRQSSNGNMSPAHNNNSADSVTPPLPASAALSVSLDSSQSQPYTFANFTNCVTRPLVKVKRFLSTLVQFGLDINTDVGERVRSLVLSLVSSNLSIEEFHHSLQEVTNFPLRPFVLPFLKAHLPLLQREIHALSRANKQSPLQYVRTHEHMILDPASSPTEPSEIFLSNDTPVSTGTKRRMSDLIYENGLNGPPQQDSLDYGPIKRPLTSQNAFLFSHQSLLLPNITSAVPNHHIFDYSQQQGHTYAQQSRQDEDINRNFNNNNINNRGDEEWRNIHTMLNCILTMVEKTKRALTILQQRNNQDVTNDWFRRQDVSVDLKKAANEIMLQAVKQTEDRVAEVKRKAEEAVNDVKRQAVIELQKAVSAAEVKANEILASERAKMDKLLTETKKSEDLTTHTTDSAENNPSPPSHTQPAPSQQNSCWNCGRKAHETCSGCNTARYCGSFCQHKDWDNHHQMCSREKTRSLITTINSSSSSTSSTTTTPSNGCTTVTSQQQVTQTDQQIKFKK